MGTCSWKISALKLPRGVEKTTTGLFHFNALTGSLTAQGSSVTGGTTSSTGGESVGVVHPDAGTKSKSAMTAKALFPSEGTRFKREGSI